MSVRVYNKEAFHGLRDYAQKQDCSDSNKRNYSKPKEVVDSSINTRYSKADAEMLHRKHAKFQQEQENLEKRVAQATADNIRKNQSRKDAYYLKLCRELENADALAQELQDRIDLQDASDERRREKLFQEWKEQVYDKVNDPINASLDKLGYEALTKRRREAYQGFLNQTNIKGALFRDIILESEYNPLADNPSIRSKCATLDDPCARVLIRRQQEEDIANRGKPPAPKKPNGRADNLDVKLWQTGVIESTPHGYFNKMMNSSPTSKSNKAHKSRVEFDHYNVATGYEVLKAELPRGKRTEFGFDVKAHTSQVHLGSTDDS